MRIFYVSSVLGPYGGSEMYVRDLLNELIRRGHELFIFTPEKHEIKGAKFYHVPVIGHDALNKFETMLFYWKAIELAKKFKPDIVQSHSNSCQGFIAHMVKRNLKIPHVMLIELISSINFNAHTKFVFQFEKFVMPKLNYNKIIVWTKNMKENFLVPWGIKEKRIEIIPAALNLQNYNIKANGREIREKYGKHLITSIKSLWGTNAEGLKYIIKAMKYVRKEHPKYKYVIFGDGPKFNELKEFTKKLGLEQTVKFGGRIDTETCRKVWAATEIAPHSYVYEFSTSISLLEYMAEGKANVVTDIGAVRELVGDAAIVVKPYNPKAMAEGIIKLIEDKKLRKKIEKKAKERARKKNDIRKAVDRMEEIYKKLLK